MLQRRLEEGKERLQQFRRFWAPELLSGRLDVADRKRSQHLEEVELKILAAEEEVRKAMDKAEGLPGVEFLPRLGDSEAWEDRAMVNKRS